MSQPRIRIFAVCLCLIINSSLSVPSFGQTAVPQAKKFDEFTEGTGSRILRWLRNYDEQNKELKIRFARYARELRRVGARPYAITYSPRVVEAEFYNRSIAGMRAGALWEMTPSGFDWKQINTVHGGFREEATTELWIVPPGAQPPCPTPTVRPEDVAYCPFVRITSTPYIPRPSSPIEFKAVVSANDKKIEPTFAWQVSQGKIISGQGTDTIAVEVPVGAAGEIVAKVELHGYSLECPIEATATFSQTTVGVSHYKFDEFGDIRMGDTKARLDNLAITLQSDPTLQAHVVVYAGRGGRPDQARVRAAVMKDYLMNRGTEEGRIITLDGGYRNELSGELWLSLRGAGAPQVRPTIDKSYGSVKNLSNSHGSPAFAFAFGQTGNSSLWNFQDQPPCGLQPSRKIDAYANISTVEEQARLDKFASLLDGEAEDVKGFIVGYAGRSGRTGQAQALADRAKAYLVEKSVFYNSRLNTVDCGYREEQATELWISAIGGAPPFCSPTVKPGDAQIKGLGRQRSPSRRVPGKSFFR
jgi:outer membrane protein OmpA-like peptidoglycan-associated protein